MHNYITSTRKISDISVVLYGSTPMPRMNACGPRCLLQVQNKTLLDIQYQLIIDAIKDPEILICGGYEVHKLINKGYKIIENQIESNECEDIRLALNICEHKNILLLDQCVLPSTLKFNYKKSFILNGQGQEEISINYSSKLESLSFNDNPNKWKGITFIHKNDFAKFKSLLDTRKYTKSFLFEMLNSLIELNLSFETYNTNATIIDSTKKLRELNEDINTIN